MTKLTPDTLKKVTSAIAVYRFYESLCNEKSPKLVDYQRLYAQAIWRGRLALRILSKLTEIKQVQQSVEGEKDIDPATYHRTLRTINDTENQMLSIINRLFLDVPAQQLDVSAMGWRSATF